MTVVTLFAKVINEYSECIVGSLIVKRLLIPLIAVLGLIFGFFMMYRGTLTPRAAEIRYMPARSPYNVYIATEGIVEAGNENCSLGVPFSEVIEAVYAKVGDHVCKGQKLFTLDTRQLKADLKEAQANFVVACTHASSQIQIFSYYENLCDKNAVSKRDYIDAYFAKAKAIDQMRASLARVQQVQMQINRSTICSPLDGVILQDEVQVGEIANQNSFNKAPFIVCGDIDYVQIRIDIAEEDAWRYVAGAAATAFVRGNSSIEIPLEYDYIEPLIVPKKTLTGSDFEAIDTRVLQVIYRFDKKSYPIYVGQLLDVYIDASCHKNHYSNQEYNDTSL